MTAIEIHMYGLKIFVKENKKKFNSDISKTGDNSDVLGKSNIIHNFNFSVNAE